MKLRTIVSLILFAFFLGIVFSASCVDNGTYAYIDTTWTSTGCCSPPSSYWGCPPACGSTSSCTCRNGCGDCTNCCATSGSGGSLTYYCTGTSCTQSCSPNSIAGCAASCCIVETESCDGADNDCDGVPDNGFECVQGSQDCLDDCTYRMNVCAKPRALVVYADSILEQAYLDAAGVTATYAGTIDVSGESKKIYLIEGTQDNFVKLFLSPQDEYEINDRGQMEFRRGDALLPDTLYPLGKTFSNPTKVSATSADFYFASGLSFRGPVRVYTESGNEIDLAAYVQAHPGDSLNLTAPQIKAIKSSGEIILNQTVDNSMYNLTTFGRTYTLGKIYHQASSQREGNCAGGCNHYWAFTEYYGPAKEISIVSPSQYYHHTANVGTFDEQLLVTSNYGNRSFTIPVDEQCTGFSLCEVIMTEQTAAKSYVNDLISYWPFDMDAVVTADGTPVPVEDIIGSNDGTSPEMYHPQVSPSEIKGNALYFDATDYLDVGDSETLNFTVDDNYSIQAWIKTSAQTGGSDEYPYNEIFARRSGRDTGNCAGVFPYYLAISLLRNDNFGKVYFGISGANLYSNKVVNDGRWHQIIVTRDRADKKLKMYIDGQLDNSVTDNSTYISCSGEPTTIGVNLEVNVSQRDFFEGDIDEVAVWDRAITNSEILNIYNNYLTDCGFTPTVCGDGFYDSALEECDGSPFPKNCIPKGSEGECICAPEYDPDGAGNCVASVPPLCGNGTLNPEVLEECDGTANCIAPGQVLECHCDEFSTPNGAGQCITFEEVCNGLDDDGDTFVDEEFQCVNSIPASNEDKCSDECKITTSQKNSIEDFSGEITGPRKISATINCLYDSTVTLQLKTEEGIIIDVTPTATECNTTPSPFELDLTDTDLFTNTFYPLTAVLQDAECSTCVRTIELRYYKSGPNPPEIVPENPADNSESLGKAGETIPDNNLFIVVLLALAVSMILTGEKRQ